MVHACTLMSLISIYPRASPRARYCGAAYAAGRTCIVVVAHAPYMHARKQAQHHCTRKVIGATTTTDRPLQDFHSYACMYVYLRGQSCSLSIYIERRDGTCDYLPHSKRRYALNTPAMRACMPSGSCVQSCWVNITIGRHGSAEHGRSVVIASIDQLVLSIVVVH